MGRSGRALSIIALVFVLAPGAWADDPPLREGFWIGFGLGYGSAGTTCDWPQCEVDREGSVTGFLNLGGTFKARVLLGIESRIWVNNADDGTNTLGSLSGTVTYYLTASSGLFLKGGLGLSYASRETPLGTRVNYPVGTTGRFDGTGWGFLFGLGYDLRVARSISITPSVTYYWGSTGTPTVQDLDLVLPGTRHDVVDFALGITFH